MQFRKIFGKIAAAMLLPLSFQAVAAAGQPIYHQDFREFGENGSLPKSWDPNGDLRIVKIDGRMALAITGNGYAAWAVPLPEGCTRIDLRCQYKTSNLTVGAKGWQNGRLALAFLDKDKRQTGPWPEVPNGDGSCDWKTFEKSYSVPAGAEYFRITPANFGTGGIFYCTDIELRAEVPPAALKPGQLYRQNFSEFAVDAALPKSWDPNGKVRVTETDSGMALAITDRGFAAWAIPLPDGAKSIRLSCRYKSDALVVGKEAWQDGRLALAFLNAEKEHIGPWPEVPHCSGNTDWKKFERVYQVPAGARFFRITPANFGSAGTFYCTDIEVDNESVYDLPRPAAVRDDPALSLSWRSDSPTRGKICLNGLWRFYPGMKIPREPVCPQSGSGWGYFKVPGIWPQRGDWMFAGAEQSVLICKARSAEAGPAMQYAWYQRNIIVPADWQGREIALDFTMLQSYAKVFLDGKEAGELIFPGGKLPITKFATPGKVQNLTIYVTARPLAAGRTIFTAPDRAFKESGFLRNRGITGDLYLESSPGKGNSRIDDIRVYCNTADKTITLDFAAQELPMQSELTAELQHTAPGRENMLTRLGPIAPSASGRKAGRMSVTFAWPDVEPWDLDTPQNQYVLTLKLKKNNTLLDQSLPVRFGFRDFKASGRDFLLNGKKVHLRGMILKTPQSYAGQTNYDACYRALKRLKDMGYNFFITSNYGFSAGDVGYQEALYKAADDLGVLCSYSLPHLSAFEWRLEDSAFRESFLALSGRLIELVGNHPSIVLWAMNHNATGYEGDQNPLTMTGKFTPAKLYNEQRRKKALQAAELIRAIDPTRVIYNHQSGNLGEMYTLNIYLNWSPIQERSDWLATWSKEGIKPLFFVEWGPPHISNWADYRGPGFIWNCRALIQLWDAEFAAAEQGQEAYLIDETSRRNLLEQQRRYREGVPYQWPVLLRSTGFQFQEKNYLDVQSVFVNDNWRSHRAHGISAMLLWDQDGQFLPTPNEKIIDYSEKYNNINAPGIVPDQIQPSLVLLYGKSVDNYLYAPEGTPRKLTSLGRSMFRWNQPFCAFIGGRANDFTEKRHNYFPGERVSRTLVMINDTRQTGDVVADITFPGTEFRRKFTTEIEPGGRKDFSFDLQLPDGIKPGRYQLEMTCTMTLPKNTNESNQPYLKQEDRFTIDIVAKPVTSQTPTVYLFDPAGKTADLFRDAKISFTQIGQEELLAGTKHFPADATVVIGRDGLNDLSLTIPELSKMVKSGLKLMVMEQQPKVLNERFGFRIQVLGLRKVFAVDRTHSLFAGKNMRELSDWAGESTMTPPYVDGATSADPRWIWNGFENTRVWRCRNRGNVASVLIEKPERGGFEPLLTGGFDLQYTPLLELRDGKGIVLFSQLDFSGRTENDPAAISLLHDMISYLASGPKPDEERFRTSPRHLVYSGNQEILEVLESLGFKPEKFTANETLEKNTLLVLGPDFDRQIAPAELRSRGVNIFAIGLNAAESERVTGRRFANVCRLPDHSALDVGRGALRGISQADLYWRGEIPFAAPVEPRNAVEKSGALFIGSSASGEGQVLLLQVSPKWFEVNNPVYFRKTARRSWYLVGQLLSNLGAPAVSGVPALLEKSGIITTIELDSGWVGKSDPDETGRKNGWYEDNFNTGDWKAIKVPGMFDQQFPDVKKIGLFWYCRKFMLPKNFAGEELTLSLGIVDDESWVWLNGKFLGELTGKTHPEIYWHTPRNYTLSPDMLRYGQENSLVVLVRNLRDSGGMIGVPRLWAPARFLQSYYVQAPVASDDPYRYYRW